jgi:hypothetical protein
VPDGFVVPGTTIKKSYWDVENRKPEDMQAEKFKQKMNHELTLLKGEHMKNQIDHQLDMIKLQQTQL